MSRILHEKSNNRFCCQKGTSRLVQIPILFIVVLLLLSACQKESVSLNPETLASPSNVATINTPTLDFAQLSPSLSSPLNKKDFATPSIDSVTAIPPDLTDDLSLPEEVRVWLFLGSDQEPPFIGKTPAIHLVLFNPRLAKASVISIPGNLFVYIPGYTMQRISTAYALGGISLLYETLRYNFGIVPEHYVLAHPGDFEWLVDDLGGLEVSVLFPMPEACNGIRAGIQYMNGKIALCYVSYQSDDDEMDRMLRQQQLLRLMFNELTANGTLARLPVLYASFQDWVKTDLSLLELTKYIPLAHKLGDPDRVKYFIIGWDAVELWELPDKSQVKVFLPDQNVVKTIIMNAIDVVMQPAPLSAVVLTLEYQYYQALTATPQSVPTRTPTPTPKVSTPTNTMTSTGTISVTPSVSVTTTPTPTVTQAIYP